MIDKGTPPKRSIKPPGFINGKAGHARGHLLGKQLGGSGSEKKNLVTLFQNPVNSPNMRDMETLVKKAVNAGEIVNYTVTPEYFGNNLIPNSIHMLAVGDKGFYLNYTVVNL